jgi:DNA ligase-1
MKLERLYKTAKTGATQIIDMTIDGDTYTRTWGQLDGKQQSKPTTAKPKNIGRSNETTAAEQAIIEAKAVWAKKQKANYSTSMEAPVLVELPMKVNVYQKHLKKIKFPCYVSPKLNGVNAEYRRTTEGLTLLSRGGESYPIPEHHISEINAAMDAIGTDRLNGEIYIHGEHLQDITGAIKKPRELTKSLVFYIFDVPTVTGDYTTRGEAMFKYQSTEFVKVVDVSVVNSTEYIDAAFDEVVDLGYEGLMVRLPEGLYEYNTRSLSVFKYKKALDAEFLVHGYNLDKNGHCVFEAFAGSPEEGKSFKVKLKGTNEERLAMADNADAYVGKYLKAEYECLSASGIPLKPVGIMFRKVDDNGEAAE